MSQPDEHVKVSIRHMAGAMLPAQVTPYCRRCNIAWPCPPVALAQPAAPRSTDARSDT